MLVDLATGQRTRRASVWWCITCVLAVLVLTRPASGQRLNVATHGHQQGLPQSQITALFQDSAGFLWMGSNSGIIRYDGAAFHALTSRDGLSDNLVASLTGAHDVLYVGTVRAGVCAVTGDRVVGCLRASDGLPSDQVTHLRMGGGDTLWVSTSAGLAAVLRDSVVRTYTRQDGLPAPVVLGSFSVNGRLWVNTPRGVVSLRDGRFSKVPSTNAARRVSVVLPTEDGAYLAGTDGLFHHHAGTVERIEIPDLPAGTPFTDATMDASGTAWFTTLDGVVSYHNHEVRRLTTENGLGFDQVNCVLVDTEGDVWFGTDHGLSKLIPGPFELYGTEEGLPGPVGRALAEDGSGRLWIGTRRGAAVFDGHRFRPVPLPAGVANPSVWSLARAPSGGMLVATQSNLVWYGPQGTRVYGTDDGLPAPRVNTLTADDSGVWVGTSAGLVRWENGRLRPAGVPALRRLFILSSAEDAEGRLWLGPLPGGLFVLDKDSLRNAGGGDPVTQKAIWDITVDGQGRTWAGSNGDGAFVIHGDSVRQITTRDGLVNDFVWQVLPDTRGGTWLFTSDGLDRLAEDGTIAHYGPADGLVDTEGAAAAALEDRHGILWFGSVSGVFRYDAKLDVSEPTPPPIYLASLTAGHITYPLTGARLPARPGVVSLQFSSPTFRDPTALRFRYRLLGTEETDWSEPTAGNAVSLASVAPGDYTFEVEAINGDGVHSAAPATASFVVLPAFWQTLWFRAGLLLLASGIVAGVPVLRARTLARERNHLEGLVREQTGELQARAERLEGEVAERKRLQEQVVQTQKLEMAGRLAAGVAHEFNNLLQSVLGHAQLLREEIPERDPLRGDLDQIEEAAQRGAGLVSQLLGFSRRQVMEEQRLDVGEVVQDLASLLHPLVGAQVALEIQARKGEASVRFDWARLQQIIMNLATNALDAMPTGGRLSLVVDIRDVIQPWRTVSGEEIPVGRYQTLEVRDTGSGMNDDVLSHVFEPFFTTRNPALHTGLGLSMTYGSVRQFGGYLDIESTPGAGTTACILLPILDDIQT